MHVTQGTFSYLPPLTNEQIRAQIEFALGNGWPISIEYTDDPHPRNVYWEMFDLPMFDERNADAVMAALDRARTELPEKYLKINAYDRSLGRQTTALSFIVQRPTHERGFTLDRVTSNDRVQRYMLRHLT